MTIKPFPKRQPERRKTKPWDWLHGCCGCAHARDEGQWRVVCGRDGEVCSVHDTCDRWEKRT